MNHQNSGTLIMLSGGILSLFVLIDLLKNTNDEIFAHHVRLKAKDINNSSALESCNQISDYCRIHYREFSFSQSMLDYHDLSIAGIEHNCIAYEAALAAQPMSNHKFPVGRCLIARNDEPIDNAPLYFQHVDNCFSAASFPNVAPPLQKIRVNRDSALKSLPPELSKIAASLKNKS